MAQLRAYYYNRGDMLELVRYQKAEQPKAAGCEQEISLPAQIFQSEKMRKKTASSSAICAGILLTLRISNNGL